MTGKWQGTTKTGAKVALDVTATTTALTGTITVDGQTLAIADGKVAKDTFSFNVILGERTQGFSGKLGKDEINVWVRLARPRERCGPETRQGLTARCRITVVAGLQARRRAGLKPRHYEDSNIRMQQDL